MAEKKQLYKAEMLTLTPVHAVVGDAPTHSLEQDGHHSLELKQLKLDLALEPSVKRLIAHFKADK
jgi:hypothetical protein